ncbi:hypothetical protein [Thioclava kandeliae]|uniref:SAM-dependent methyltransferase n=1 Tax=Thioclava kandeliae TaxID=3070818 RepID=A0ABV1SLB1_9RHOB
MQSEHRTDWLAQSILKHHQTLATTINTLLVAGFAPRRIKEFAPTQDQIEAMPELAEEKERPMMLVVSAFKI